MKSIKRSTNESVNDLIQSLEERGIAPKGRILHIGPSNTVKNVVGKDVSSLPNITGNGITLSQIFDKK